MQPALHALTGFQLRKVCTRALRWRPWLAHTHTVTAAAACPLARTSGGAAAGAGGAVDAGKGGRGGVLTPAREGGAEC
eukprot:365511-Chlamydomonas_euryale.AAC.1